MRTTKCKTCGRLRVLSGPRVLHPDSYCICRPDYGASADFHKDEDGVWSYTLKPTQSGGNMAELQAWCQSEIDMWNSSEYKEEMEKARQRGHRFARIREQAFMDILTGETPQD